MARVYNFSAGPATMPLPVLEEIQAELLDYQGSGMSVMEMSHRSKVFQQIADEAEADLRELVAITLTLPNFLASVAAFFDQAPVTI